MGQALLEAVTAYGGAELLSRELLDFVSANAEWLSAEVPGFAEALAWPQGNGE